MVFMVVNYRQTRCSILFHLIKKFNYTESEDCALHKNGGRRKF
jgi:hypothetical protein